MRNSSPARVVLPKNRDPLLAVMKRFGLAVLVIFVVACVVRMDSEGYRDSKGDGVSMLDAVYYATVSVTTTGYGDIVPVTNAARVLTSSVVTLARILFLILLVGTTVEVLTERGRDALSRRRWRKKLHNHVIVCGYGTKGRSAVTALLGQGWSKTQIVVIDTDRALVEEAAGNGLAGVVGDAGRISVLEQAELATAKAIVVAPNDDAKAVLITLTAREVNPSANIVSAVRESDNAHLLRQGGADSVIVSSEAAGRLLGLATGSPHVVEVLEDLLATGTGIDIVERPIRADEVGKPAQSSRHELIVAIVHRGKVLHHNRDTHLLEADDCVIILRS